MAEEKVLVRIPIDQLNLEDKTKTVMINGKFYEIERGKDVYVPKEVREILIRNEVI